MPKKDEKERRKVEEEKKDYERKTMKERTLERKKAEEVKGKGRKDKIKAKRKDEIELEKAQSVLTSGGIVRRHDLLRDANLTTTQCTSPTLNSPHLRPSKEERDLLNDPSRPEGERKKQKKAE